MRGFAAVRNTFLDSRFPSCEQKLLSTCLVFKLTGFLNTIDKIWPGLIKKKKLHTFSRILIQIFIIAFEIGSWAKTTLNPIFHKIAISLSWDDLQRVIRYTLHLSNVSLLVSYVLKIQAFWYESIIEMFHTQ